MAKDALTIFSYTEDPGDNPSRPSDADTFVAPINPERFSHRRTVRFNEEENASDKGDTAQNQGYGEDTVTFDLVFDGTGAIPEVEDDVVTYIEKLEKVAYDYESEIHMPRYLVMVWGEFGFKCKLQSLSVEYQLFKPDGTPLRAKASLTLRGHLSPKARELKGDSRSPDLTRIRTIRQGDALPLLCQEFYGSPLYYLQVAEANSLSSFRDLEVGSQLIFPPLER
ncbi:MAG: peptidoglycan-binding protein [Bacteroidetes bacterium]|nr:MAG: peptidoglycan-binding protein [Bacteroidota bacterium]